MHSLRKATVFMLFVLCLSNRALAALIASAGFNDASGINNDAENNSPYTTSKTVQLTGER